MHKNYATNSPIMKWIVLYWNMSKKDSPNTTLIFTDLDGTLLDHHNYSFDAAKEMLLYIKMKQIPMIIVTSKTKNEVIALQKELNITMPFIVENGAGIYIPNGERYASITMGKTHTEILEAFETCAKVISMRGFSDMSDEEVAKLTDLPLQRASAARLRNYTEPFVLNEHEKLSELTKMANKDGLDIVKGGRFYHLITQGQDKAQAIKYVIKHYQKMHYKKFKTVALGDSTNDLTMLQSVDIPILIPQADGNYISHNIDHIIKAPYPGPQGWNAALKEYFNVQ